MVTLAASTTVAAPAATPGATTHAATAAAISPLTPHLPYKPDQTPRWRRLEVGKAGAAASISVCRVLFGRFSRHAGVGCEVSRLGRVGVAFSGRERGTGRGSCA